MGLWLREFTARNYRSLRDVTIREIGNLAVFIGGNSSGKSNLIEAMTLFFGEFDPAPQRAIGAVSDYLWFDQVCDIPIEFKAKVELDEGDLTRVLPTQLKEGIKSGAINTLVVVRQITGNPASATWVTKDILLNNKEIIKDGQLKPEVSPPTVGPPEQGVTPPATEVLGRVLQAVSELFKGSFKVIPSARDQVGASARFGDRMSLIQQAQIAELTALGGGFSKPQTDRWAKVEQYVTRVSSEIEDVRVLSGQIAMREAGARAMSVPISLEGGGHQSILSLIYQVSIEEGIFGLEEPEMHLYPRLARRLFEVLTHLSLKKQIFISTHSTVFLDYSQPKDTWILRRKGKETQAARIEQPEQLAGVLDELGIRPSDIFFANGIVFVEGETDKVVLEILGEKIRPTFGRLGLSIIPLHGKDNGVYHLAVWLDVAKSTGIPLFMVLDKDAQKEAKKVGDALREGENLFLLKKGSIEEYYHERALNGAISRIYAIELDENDKKKLYVSPRDKAIQELLHTRKKDFAGWKVAVGREVAREMTVAEIDNEIKTVIERISTVLTTQFPSS